MGEPRTLFDKIWDSHLVDRQDDGTCLIYIDRHLVHEVTSPQAFEGLKLAGRAVRRPDATTAVVDHNVPTTDRSAGITDPEARLQVETLAQNAKDHGITYFGMDDIRQGIVHIVGPEQGLTLPGTTIVCGDSHTATHGAFGALAFGIGTSEVEHVLATQTLMQRHAKNMLVEVEGDLALGVTAKDVILFIIGRIGTAGGTGHVIEYAGSAIRSLDMAGRMTVCNMSIEGGARAGLIAPDETTFEYLKGRPYAPKGAAWEQAEAYWRTLPSDPGAHYDKIVRLDAAEIVPHVTWGTSPEDVLPITGRVPDPAEGRRSRPSRGDGARARLYGAGARHQARRDPGAEGLHRLLHQRPHRGSAPPRPRSPRAARWRRGVNALVVPGSGLVKHQAEAEGLDKIFLAAGFEWREPGCSMCLAMNADKLKPGERCASTRTAISKGGRAAAGAPIW